MKVYDSKYHYFSFRYIQCYISFFHFDIALDLNIRSDLAMLFHLFSLYWRPSIFRKFVTPPPCRNLCIYNGWSSALVAVFHMNFQISKVLSPLLVTISGSYMNFFDVVENYMINIFVPLSNYKVFTCVPYSQKSPLIQF